ncbi:hypothetical protein EDB19DRAFT_1701821 [Suillus lakei]|nr:hypothetical protein EDB19DRAFT_1701821 [Suillus lakei]
MSIEISKRTRSQLAVPDHVLRLPLARSPLKHARVTSRNQLHVDEHKEGEGEMDIEEEEDENENDEILLSPKKNKRSSETCPEDLLSPASYREPKRVKIDPLPALTLLSIGHSVENRDFISQSPRKLAKSFVRAATESACHATNGKAKLGFIFSGRARSVPLPTDHVPELDLRTLSPIRSPRKVPNQLEITPVPPPTEAAQPSPLTPFSATDEGAPSTEHAMDVDTASAISHFTNVPKFDLKLPDPTNLMIPIESATPRNLTGYPSHMSLSPLTPLPPTSFVGRRPAVPSLFAAVVEKKVKQSQDVADNNSSLNVAGSSTSSAAPSRLPRPSISAPSLMPPPPVPVKRGRSATIGSSHTARSKPIANLSKGKKVMLPPSGPRRVTRSVSLKEKRPESLDKSDAPPEASTVNTSLRTNDEPASVAPSSQASTFKVPNLDRPSVKSFPDPAKFKQTSLASFIKAKPAPSSSTTDPSPSTCVQRLPPSPSRIPLPVSPIKQCAGTSSVKRSFIGGSSNFGPSKPKSSLFTLSTALEKLAMPPPSRPNTSLGFNVSSDKDEHKRAGHSVVKDDSALTGSSGTFARPTASSLKRHATVSGPSRISMVGRMKDRGGALGRTTTGVFGPGLVKPSMKASRKTSLPSVMASPVKGGGGGTFDDNIINATANLWEQNKEADLVIEELVGSADKGKQREGWDSRRASSALHALSRSLSALPKTPPKLVAAGTRTGLRSSSSTYHDASGSGFKFAQDAKDKGKFKEGTETSNAPSKSDAAATAGKSVLKVLKKCAIFVDVRTDDGDDAGSLFVDMLRGLGARILARVGQSCTHIVYKNGSASTLTRYRLLNDPKPLVVGIAWVVDCVEQRCRVDEVKFKVDLELVGVAGTNKKRRSMLPRHMSPSTGSGFIQANPSSEAGNNEGQRQPDDGSGSPAQDADTSIRSAKDELDDLPPLERARRRRSFLPGGQTRLI